MDAYDLAKEILAKSASWACRAFMPLADIMPYGSVVIQGQSVATVTTTAAIQLTWPCDGLLVGIRMTCRDGTAASMGGSLLRLVVDGQEELFPSGSGSGAGYLSAYMISGSGQALARYHVRRPFRQATAWQIYLNNTTAGTVVYDLAFDYVNTRNPRL